MIGVNTVSEEVSPETATRWLTEWRYPKQRAIAGSRISEYVYKMRSGEWFENHPDQIVVAVHDGRNYLINGQHRLSAVRCLKRPFVFRVSYYAFGTMQEVDFLYSVLDRGKRRVWGDVNTSDNAVSLGNTKRSQATAGIRLTLLGFTRRTSGKIVTEKEIADEFDRNSTAIANYFASTSNPSKSLSRTVVNAPTMAVGIASYQYTARVYGKQKIDDFWHAVSTGDGLNRTDPRYMAREHLLTAKISTTQIKPGDHRKGLFDVELYAKTLAYWLNLWCKEGDTGVNRRGANSNSPNGWYGKLEILGSPWQG